jgi:hypothetical protein
MKINLTVWQKVLIVFVCFTIAIAGFMLKLPTPFRKTDKELHATFYFLAAALLNTFFAGTSFIRHAVIFTSLYFFGMAIEFAQSYSNRFFLKRIHGRFDPEDVEWNLKGLIAFSVLWILVTIVILIVRRNGSTKLQQK